MAVAKPGDRVEVHYTGYLEDGTIFDSSRSEDREAFVFTVGEGAVIDGFDRAVVGLETGASRTVEVTPEQAYGERDEKLMFTVERKHFPEDLELSVGMLLEIGSAENEGARADVSVVEYNDEEVTLDANHPLAGQRLKFEIELLNIV